MRSPARTRDKARIPALFFRGPMFVARLGWLAKHSLSIPHFAVSHSNVFSRCQSYPTGYSKQGNTVGAVPFLFPSLGVVCTYVRPGQLPKHTHTFGSDGRIARQIIRVQSRDRFSREFKKRMASIGSTSYQKHRTDQWFVSGERRSTNMSSRVRTELRSHSGWVGETRGRAGTI